MMYNLFNMLLDPVLQNFVEDFLIYVHFVFFLVFLSDFAIPVMLGSQKEFGCFLPPEIFWRSLSRTGVSSYLNFLVEFTCEAIGSQAFDFGKSFYYSFDFCTNFDWSLNFSISPWFSFGRLSFSKNFLFIPSCPFYW